MKIEVIGKNKQLFVGYTNDEEYCIFSSEETEFVSSKDLLFNSTDENGYFTSRSTGEEFISLAIVSRGLSKKAALDQLFK